MKLNRVAITFFFAAVAWGQKVAVDVRLMKEELVPLTVLMQAKRIVGWVYADIGVTVKWSSGSKQMLTMQFDTNISDDEHPGALGYAAPYAKAGTCIHLLVDRLTTSNPAKGTLLGYTMAHELAHVLQGYPSHSEEGVLKAHWTHSDQEKMSLRRLSFSAGDAASIRSGVERWMQRSTPPSAVTLQHTTVMPN